MTNLTQTETKNGTLKSQMLQFKTTTNRHNMMMMMMMMTTKSMVHFAVFLFLLLTNTKMSSHILLNHDSYLLYSYISVVFCILHAELNCGLSFVIVFSLSAFLQIIM